MVLLNHTQLVKTSTDRYYISVLYECNDKPKLNNNKSVGIDVGIKTFAVLSDGMEFENQKLFKSNLRKLRVLQRSVSRKYRGPVLNGGDERTI